MNFKARGVIADSHTRSNSSPIPQALLINAIRQILRWHHRSVLTMAASKKIHPLLYSPPLLCLLWLFSTFFATLSSAQDFDFFYFVQQWPGSYCDTRNRCCYPTTGKPEADFGIHGLWPNYNSGAYPSNCDPDSPYRSSTIKDLIGSMKKEWPTLACPSNDGNNFWKHEWEKHGTCSESILDQHAYFESALELKKTTSLLQILKNAGIEPDGGNYSMRSIKDAISQATGFTPWIECNEDEAGNKQLYQVYMCVDTSAAALIECPAFPRGSCSDQIEFPPF